MGFVSLFTVLFFSFGSQLGWAANDSRNICQVVQNTSGIAHAVCQFPSCPTGGDCRGPEIDTKQARVEYFEPLLRWKENCPNLSFDQGPCWEVYLEVNLRLRARDQSGVSDIGVKLYLEQNGKRSFHEVWSPTAASGSQDTYSLREAAVFHVPANNEIQFGVAELCAKDNRSNQNCVTNP